MNTVEKPPRTNDPQIVTESTLKSGEKSDVLVFSLRFLFFELAFIAVIPDEGEIHAPVYIKHKIVRYP